MPLPTDNSIIHLLWQKRYFRPTSKMSHAASDVGSHRGLARTQGNPRVGSGALLGRSLTLTTPGMHNRLQARRILWEPQRLFRQRDPRLRIVCPDVRRWSQRRRIIESPGVDRDHLLGIKSLTPQCGEASRTSKNMSLLPVSFGPQERLRFALGHLYAAIRHLQR